MNYREMCIYRDWGFLPGINEEFIIHPAYEDNGPSLEIVTHREFNIEDQISSEFWNDNMRHEFWPAHIYGE